MLWHFLIRGHLGVLRGYLNPQFEKMLIWHWSPNGLKFWFLLFHWPPLLSDFKVSQFYITFWSEFIQGYLWGKMMKINIGLQIFSDLQKNIIFATTYKFRRALSWRNFEFCPWIKIKIKKVIKLKVIKLKVKI